MTKGKKRRMTKGRADNREKVDEDKGGNAPSVPIERENFKIAGRDNLRDELLPSIPNHIAWQVIAPKLSGEDINTLSLVSPSWREAIHRGWVYDVRVSSHSTETFIVLLSKGDTCNLRLYPLNGNSAYDLPPIPEDIRRESKCIPLDGKIYTFSCWNRGMFVLDLAGHKQWKQCAIMQEGRGEFCAGVLDGKIYVIRAQGHLVCKCKVYDPKVDAWSSIADLIPLQILGRVASIRGEIFVYGGMEYHENGVSLIFSQYAVAYNPAKNEWRQLGHFSGDADKNPWVDAFVAQGRFHTMTPNGIDVYDMDTNSWSSLHSLPQRRDYLDTWAVNDEILTIFEVDRTPTPPVCLFQSRGFGKKNRELAFKAVGNRRLTFDVNCLPRWKYEMYPIQL